MNQCNLISIIPTIPSEMASDEVTKSQKRRNLIERLRKLITRLSQVYESSSDTSKRKLNEEYQQRLHRLEKPLLSGHVSRSCLSKIERSFNTMEEKIRDTTDSIFQHFRITSSDNVSPIDLTNDDSTNVVHNSSLICEDESEITDLTQEDEAPLIRGRNSMPLSTNHSADKIQEIIDIDEVYNNIISGHPTIPNAQEKNTSEGSIDKSPALKILEMAKKNTNSSSSSTVSGPSDVTERVTRMIQILPEEDKMVLKGGVDKVQELVEKKTKLPYALHSSTDDSASSSKIVQTKLSDLLREQMNSELEVSKVPMKHSASKSELSNNVTLSNVQSSVNIPKPVHIDHKVVRPNQYASSTKEKIVPQKHPPPSRLEKQFVKKMVPVHDENSSVVNTSQKFSLNKGDGHAPSSIEQRKSDLKTKFHQEISKLHKCGSSYHKPPSLKQLKSDRRLSPEKPVVNCNKKPQSSITSPSHSKNANPKENQDLNNTKSTSTQNQISNNIKCSAQQITTKRNHSRKLVPVPQKKNPTLIISQPRQRTSETGFKSNTSTLETNTQQKSKLSTNFQSPLSGIYDTSYQTARTGRGYGAQKSFKNTYKIPRLNKNNDSGKMKSVKNQNVPNLMDDPSLDTGTTSELEMPLIENILPEANKDSMLETYDNKNNENAVDGSKQKNEGESCKNLPGDSMIDGLIENEKFISNIDSNEDSKRKLEDTSLKSPGIGVFIVDNTQEKEKLCQQSTPELLVGHSSNMAKTVCIALDSTLEKEKSNIMSTELKDCIRETQGNEQNLMCLEELSKQNQFSKSPAILSNELVTTSEENNSEIQPKAPKRKTQKRPATCIKLDSTSDDSDAEIPLVPQPMNTNHKIISSSDEKSDLKKNEEPTLPAPFSAESDTLRLCPNYCSCAKDIINLDDDIELEIDVCSNLPVSGCEISVIDHIEEDVEKSIQEKLEYLNNELTSSNLEAVKGEDTDLAVLLQSSEVLERLKGKQLSDQVQIINEIINTHLNKNTRNTSSEHVGTLEDDISSNECQNSVPESTRNTNSEHIGTLEDDISSNECQNSVPESTRNTSSEHIGTLEDDISSNECQNSVPASTRNTSSEHIGTLEDDISSNECQNSVSENNDHKINFDESAQPPVKPRKTKSRELDQLHADIKEWKKTKNNDIFTALGERKCRQQYKSYQNSSVKSSDLSTSSNEHLELPSDGSVHSENMLVEQSFLSAESTSDDTLSNTQFVKRSKMQQHQTHRGRRGRPSRSSIQSQSEHDTARLGPKTYRKFKDFKLQMNLQIRVSKIQDLKTSVFPSSKTDLGIPNENVNITNEAEINEMATLENETEQCKVVKEDKTCNGENPSPDIEKAIRKKKKKKKNKKKKAKENENFKKMLLKECENTKTTLDLLSTEGRRRSSILNLPINEPESVSQESDNNADSKKDSQEQKIADLPQCNAFKEAHIAHAQISCMAVECQDSKLLYKCVEPGCDYSVIDPKMFASHLSLMHKNAIWDGNCPLCPKTATIHIRADLIDALSHLMKKHLTNVEVITVVLSDDDEKAPTPVQEGNQEKKLCEPINAENADVNMDSGEESTTSNLYTGDDDALEREVSSPQNLDISEKQMNTETSTPRLRVRRLSGDILSGSNLAAMPQDTATLDSHDSSRDSALSLVIKEVKTIREKDLQNLAPYREECAASSSAATSLHSADQREPEGNVTPKPLSKSAQSEVSIVKLYKCGGASWNNPETCKFSSDTADDFLLHLYRGHMGTTNKKEKRVAKKFLKCIYCGEQNDDAEKMVQHIDDVHSICLFQCAFCEFRAARPIYLNWHRESEHRFGEEKILVTEWKDNRDEVLERSRFRQWSKPYSEIVLPFTCDSGCTYSTYSETQFIEHCKASHSGLHTWKCSLCGHECFDLVKLMMHYKIHAMARFQCRYCPFGVPNIASLKNHLAKQHPHLYPLAIERKSSSSGDGVVENSWADRITEVDLDLPLSNFESYSKVIHVDSRSIQACDVGGSDAVDRAANSAAKALPMSIVEETEAAVSAITPNENDRPTITCQQNEARRGSSSAVASSYCSDDDVSDRLIINEDESDDSSSTIAERLRQMRRTSTEIAQPIFSRTRAGKDYIKGLTGDALFKCGVAGCTISVEDYKAYGEHLRVCDNARNATGFECPHCEYKVQTTKAFLNHITLHGPARFLCTLCDYKHQQSKYVIEHMKSSAHRVHGEPKILPIHPLKNDKYKDTFVVKFDSNKIVRNRSARTPAETSSMRPLSQRLPAPSSVVHPSKQVEQITRINSLEDVEKHLHAQLYSQYIYCGICNYKDRVRSNLLNHMREHASGGVPISRNIVNPVPCIGKNETDLMFNKMSNHAGYTAKDDNKLSRKTNYETMNNSDEADKTPSIIPEFVPKRKRYVCSVPDCRYFSTDASGLRNHLCNSHSDLTEFMCPHCQISVVPLRISVHLRYHGEKLYGCSICRYVHYQRSGIEKHQKEKHRNSDYDIEVIREILSEDSEITDCESPSNSCGTAFWKCNLCGDCTGSEVIIKSHCQKEHSISYKYKCCLCCFCTLQKDHMNEHMENNHEASSKMFLSIYEEVDRMTTTLDSVPDQQKILKVPANSITHHNRTPSNAALHSDDENFSSSLTPSSSSSTNRTGLNCVEASETTRTMNVKENNEMMVEPYSDQFKCPFCETFKTTNVEIMRYHLFKEKQYDRYVCKVCGRLGVSRQDLESHVIQEAETHSPKNLDCIEKLTADPTLERKVKEALVYQYQKINPNSTDYPFLFSDSDDDGPGPSPSILHHDENNKTSPKQKQENSSLFYCSTCGNIFKTRSRFTKHKKTHKPKITVLQSPRKRASGELLSAGNSKTLYDASGKLSQSYSAKKIRHSSPSSPRTLIDSSSTYRCELCAKILDNTIELGEHQRMVHRPHACLQCDKVLPGEEGLNGHVRNSYILQHNKQPNSICKKSATKRVILKCSSPNCSHSLLNVSYLNYNLILRHMKAVHPSQTKYPILAQIDDFEPRPLTDAEISYLQVNELPSNEPVRKPRKRNVAVKSTARSTARTVEPPNKRMLLDASTPVMRTDPVITKIAWPMDKNDVITSTPPSIEVIDLSDDDTA